MRRIKRSRLLYGVAILIVVFAALILAFSNQQVIIGQADGVLPWVINTIPARGDELAVDQGVTFRFNTPMNRASVESAFSVSPAASGTFRWQDDTTFTFMPDKPLDRETAYIFEITSSARSGEGISLRDTLSLKLHTTGYLTVTQFLPEDQSTNLELKPTITIVFNRPVVPLGTAEQMQSLPAPFHTYPPMTGKGEWLTTSIYSYKPTKDLKENTEYTVIIPKGLADVSGSTVKENIAFHFRTVRMTPPPPKSFSIRYVSPEDGRTSVFRTPLIRIGFDFPADKESAEAGFSLIAPDGHVIPGKFEWNDEKYEMRFRPGEFLDYTTRYVIKVDAKNIRSEGGVPLSLGVTTSFTTLDLPQITGTSPADGSLVDPSAVMWFYFNAPMKLDDLASRVEILPKTPIAVLDSDIGPDSMSARVQFSTQPSITYTITLDTKGMVDIWGTPLRLPVQDTVYRMVGDGKIQIRYVTSALTAAMSLETAGQQMGLYNGHHQTRVFVTHRNINSVGMTLYNVSVPLFLNTPYMQYSNPDEVEKLVRRWVVPIYNPQNIMRYDLLSITGDGASIGQQGNVVCVEAAPSMVQVGQTVRVVRKEVPEDENATPDQPAPVNIRNEPGTQGSVVIFSAANGTDFTVLDGPVCADRYVWWKVQSLDGSLNGWIAEGDLKQPYIAPLNDQGDLITVAATANPQATFAPTPQAAAKPGQIAPGIYRLELEAPEIGGDSHHLSHLMLVATENITLKISRDEAFAWVTDLQSGVPAAGLSVQFYRLMSTMYGQKILPYGKPIQTDKDGIARLTSVVELYPTNEEIYAVVVSEGHFGIASSNWVQGIDAYDFQQPTMFNGQDMALYLYTDRRLYRPGDRIYFKGTIRQRDDAVYSLSDKTLIPVDIIDPFNQVIYSKKLPVNQFGSFSDSFTVADGGLLGEYRIIARPNKPDPTPTPPSSDSTAMPTSTPFIVYPTGLPSSTATVTATATSTPMPVPVLEAQAAANPEDPQFITQITVAEYTPPEFRVNITPQSPHVAVGDTIRALVDSSYYFGGPVSNAVVQWTVRTDPYYFYYSGQGRYSFEDYNQDQIAQDYEDDRPQVVSNGTGRTDDQGRYTITLPAALGKSRRSLIYTIEALVWDESNQSVAERAQVVVDQGLFQVGVGVENYVGEVNEPQTATLIAVDNDSLPLANTYLDVKVVRRAWTSVQTIEPGTGRTIWENQVTEVEVASGAIRTDALGKGIFGFVPQIGGAYKIYAGARDSKDNLIQSSTFIWIAGPGYVSWRAPNSNRIDLQTDKVSYKVGEIASILIPTPFQGTSTALITVERGGVLRTEVITMHDNSTIYKLMITPDMAPNAFVSVTVIKGEDRYNFTAAFRTGLIQLQVDAEQLRLNIAVTSDRQKAGPQEQVTYKIHVTDYWGEPVKAEIGLALVDEAILALMPDDLPSLMSYFYSRQGLGVRTSNSLIFNIDQQTQEIINVQKGGGKGGDDYFGIFTVRKNFIGTPLWEPFVTTDENGDATVVATLPDQLTTWVLDARAYTLPMGDTHTTLVGQTVHSLVSTKPLLIRPEIPRFYVVGDQSVLSAIVNNNTDEDQEVAVSVDSAGVTLNGEITQFATIPANGRLKFDWRMTVQDVESVDLTFKVVSKDGSLTDAAKPVTGTGDERLIPVLRYETPDTVTTSGVIGNEGGKRIEGLLVSAPATNAAGVSKDALEIHVDRSLATSMTAALKTLEIYPYYCIEQTVSRFLPDAVMYRAQKALGLQDKELYDSLSETLETALQRLYSDQHYDGGWGWFVGDSSDQLISAYSVLGLVEVRAAGWHIDDSVFNKAIEALRLSLRDVDDKTPAWHLNRQSFILYVLARASEVMTGGINNDKLNHYYDISRSVRLFDQRDRMNLDALAFLAMDFAIIEPESGYHTTPLLDMIKRKAKYSLTGRHWEENFYDAWNWTTDTRTTAIVLKALVQIEPSSPLLADTVRWLMTARKFDRWETTQETAWSVMALTAWMQATGDLTPNYGFSIAINDESASGDQTATGANVRSTYDLRVAVSDLLADQVNQIAIERNAGDGTLYYSAQLKTYLPVENVKALSRGIIIERSYSLVDDPDNAPILRANVGDRIRVTLTIIVPESLNYVVIEDPIPAGTQSIDTSLQTTAKLDSNQPLRYGWTYWVFTHTELRDDRTVLYAPYLPQGTYQYVYEIRAGAEGLYHVLPANGHAFYMPEIFGRTGGSMFEILPPKEVTVDAESVESEFPVLSRYGR